MQKIIFIILLGLVVSGCYMDYGTAEPEVIGEITDYDFENDIPEFAFPLDAAKWLQKNIKYLVLQ